MTTVFVVFIAEIPSIYKKIEIRNEEFYGDDKLICDAMYVNKIITTTTDKIGSL
jgi:hypothetical protein